MRGVASEKEREGKKSIGDIPRSATEQKNVLNTDTLTTLPPSQDSLSIVN